MATSRLDIEVTGEGPSVLLLHSLLTDRGAFDAIVPLLARERRVFNANLPGFGASPPADGPGIADIAQALAPVLGETGPGVDIIGNGLGSFVALALAAKHGARLGRLVLVGAAIAFPEPGRATFRALAAKAEQEGMGAVTDAAMRRLFAEDFIAAHPEIIAERAAVFRRIDPGVFAACCRALALLDLDGEVGRIANPVLVVVGDGDAATSPALARALVQRIPGAALLELPGLGHAPHVQEPVRFLAAIAPFLGLAAGGPAR